MVLVVVSLVVLAGVDKTKKTDPNRNERRQVADLPVPQQKPKVANDSPQEPIKEPTPLMSDSLGGTDRVPSTQNANDGFNSGPPAATRPDNAIAVGLGTDVTLGPPGCSVAVVNDAVVRFPGGEILSRLQEPLTPTIFNEKSLLSPDGRFFVKAEGWTFSEPQLMAVWETATGKRLFTVPASEPHPVDFIRITGGNLFICSTDEATVWSWDLATGKENGDFTVAARLGDRQTAFTSDGRYVAAPMEDRLAVIRLATGETVVKMKQPRLQSLRPAPDTVRVDEGGWIVDEPSLDHPDPFSAQSIATMCFSPSSKELFAVSESIKRFTCWNNKGELLFDKPFGSPSLLSDEAHIRWLPTRPAVFAKQDLFDCKAQRHVLHVNISFTQATWLGVFDDQHLIGTMPGRLECLSLFKIPWEAIDASLSAMEQKEPAKLAPHEPVSITFSVDSDRSRQTEMIRIMGDLVKQRLTYEGFTVTPGNPVSFRVRFAATESETQPLRRLLRLPEYRDQPEKKIAEVEPGNLILELLVSGNSDPVWREVVQGFTVNRFDEAAHREESRIDFEQSFRSVLEGISLPYFVPESEGLLTLPVIVE